MQLNNIVTEPWFQLLSLAVGVLGLSIAILTYWLSRRYKRISVSRRSFSVIDRRRQPVPRMKIFYDDKPIEDLRITKYLFWNSGKEPIRCSDFPDRERLVISAGQGVQILEAAILQSRSESCNCRLKQIDDSSYEIQFDYLDPRDGLVIQLSHTGSSIRSLTVHGRIVGAGPIESKRSFDPLSIIASRFLGNRRLRRSPFLAACILTPFMLVGMSLLPDSFPSPTGKKVTPYLFVLMAALSALLYWPLAYRVWRDRPPTGLEKFEDDTPEEQPKGGA
jgi:hypothetical protein